MENADFHDMLRLGTRKKATESRPNDDEEQLSKRAAGRFGPPLLRDIAFPRHAMVKPVDTLD